MHRHEDGTARVTGMEGGKSMMTDTHTERLTKKVLVRPLFWATRSAALILGSSLLGGIALAQTKMIFSDEPGGSKIEIPEESRALDHFNALDPKSSVSPVTDTPYINFSSIQQPRGNSRWREVFKDLSSTSTKFNLKGELSKESSAGSEKESSNVDWANALNKWKGIDLNQLSNRSSKEKLSKSSNRKDNFGESNATSSVDEGLNRNSLFQSSPDRPQGMVWTDGRLSERQVNRQDPLANLLQRKSTSSFDPSSAGNDSRASLLGSTALNTSSAWVADPSPYLGMGDNKSGISLRQENFEKLLGSDSMKDWSNSKSKSDKLGGGLLGRDLNQNEINPFAVQTEFPGRTRSLEEFGQRSEFAQNTERSSLRMNSDTLNQFNVLENLNQRSGSGGAMNLSAPAMESPRPMIFQIAPNRLDWPKRGF